MQNYSMEELANEQLVLVVTSTFGNGDSPMNGKVLILKIKKIIALTLQASSLIAKHIPSKRGGGNDKYLVTMVTKTYKMIMAAILD